MANAIAPKPALKPAVKPAVAPKAAAPAPRPAAIPAPRPAAVAPKAPAPVAPAPKPVAPAPRAVAPAPKPAAVATKPTAAAPKPAAPKPVAPKPVAAAPAPVPEPLPAAEAEVVAEAEAETVGEAEATPEAILEAEGGIPAGGEQAAPAPAKRGRKPKDPNAPPSDKSAWITAPHTPFEGHEAEYIVTLAPEYLDEQGNPKPPPAKRVGKAPHARFLKYVSGALLSEIMAQDGGPNRLDIIWDEQHSYITLSPA